jgi:hypothetical protein
LSWFSAHVVPLDQQGVVSLLLYRQASDIGHQFLYIGWLNPGAKRRHFSFAFGDCLRQHSIAQGLHLIGSQVLGVERFPAWAASTAIGRVTQDALYLKGFGRIGLGCRYPRHNQAAQKARCDELQNKLAHVLSNPWEKVRTRFRWSALCLFNVALLSSQKFTANCDGLRKLEIIACREL